MTGIYEWNPMPHKVDINCPSCGKHAIFEFAEIVRVEQKKDVTFFKESDLFDYSLFQDSCGHRWHGAIYYANLHGGSTKAIGELPDGYIPEDWNHSKYLSRTDGTDIGAFCCYHCHDRKKCFLEWPSDAYYSIIHKGEQLWAFNRETCVDLRNYISSNTRKTEHYRWASFRWINTISAID